MADAQNCRHIELPDTLWTRLRQAEEDVEHLLADKQTLAGVVTEQRLRAEAAEAKLRGVETLLCRVDQPRPGVDLFSIGRWVLSQQIHAVIKQGRDATS